MSFAAEYLELPMSNWLERTRASSLAEVRRAAAQPILTMADFAALLSPAGGDYLEELARRSQQITQQRFGKVIRLFAPLYLSNECINSCKYCGFSRENPILRVTLSVEQALQEARALQAQGFRNLLLVSGEHPKWVSPDYLAAVLRALRPEFPSLSLEVGPMETEPYQGLCAAGAEGLVVYQETYDREIYQQVHLAGPKKDFTWRLETPERAYAAGFRRLGIGALFGLADWRWEALSLAAHAQYLLRRCWKAQLTISLPRLRPCAGEFQPLTLMTDRELVQLVCALRLLLPDTGLVLSTRESAKLRDGLIPLGITMVSAGSHTDPGGYTGAGHDQLHRTERGRMVPITPNGSEWTHATGQFEISDARSPRQVEERIRQLGYEPVWKDWDAALQCYE